MNHTRNRFRILLAVMACIAALSGCEPAREAPPIPASSQSGSTDKSGPLQRVQDSGRPEITAQVISKDVVGRVIEVGEANGAGPSTEWTFEADEYRRIDILERRATDSGADVLIFMLTRSKPGGEDEDIQVSGQLRLRYEWQGGRWTLKSVENLTFRYSVGQSI